MNESFAQVPIKERVISSQENILALYKKLNHVYDKRPDMDDFVGAMADTKFAEEYSKDSVARDKAYVENKRQLIDDYNSNIGQARLDHIEDNFMFAEASQAILVDVLNKRWLPDFKSIMTSDRDDLAVGIDIVTKYKDNEYFGLAFDATVSSNENTLHKKLDEYWDRYVVKGALPVVKYFQDPDTGNKGRLTVPKFVIGASANDINDMAKAYLDNKEESLDNHPMRKLVLEQMAVQLDSALSYYEENKDPRFNFAEKQLLKAEKLVKDLIAQIDASGKIDKLTYYEYRKNSKALEIMEEYANKKKSVAINS